MLLTHVAGPPTLTVPLRHSAGLANSVDPDVRDRVWSLLGKLYPSGKAGERRGDRRYPFPQLVHLTPISSDSSAGHDTAIVVAGKHISERGIGFFHREPLAYRRVIASVQCGDRWLAFLTDLSWCRFTRLGWYESGGRFLQVVDPPINP